MKAGWMTHSNSDFPVDSFGNSWAFSNRSFLGSSGCCNLKDINLDCFGRTSGCIKHFACMNGHCNSCVYLNCQNSGCSVLSVVVYTCFDYKGLLQWGTGVDWNSKLCTFFIGSYFNRFFCDYRFDLHF